MTPASTYGRAWIGAALLLYLAASLLHFAHNAEYLAGCSPSLPRL